MKKYLAVILSCMMMLGFSACGNTENFETDTSVSQMSELDSSDIISETIADEETVMTSESENLFDESALSETFSETEESTTVSETEQTEIQTEVSYETEQSEVQTTAKTEIKQAETQPADVAPETTKPEPQTTKTLVVYFSCTGNTKAVAERITDLCNADIYEIIPSEPYTSEDLDYNQSNCRANLEMNDESSRPAIGSDAVDISGYDTVFIGYPIWWGTMPRIINTFLDTYDLSDKTVMPFCTSGGSGVSRSVSDIKDAEPNADVRSGLRADSANDKGIDEWLADNDIQ